MRVFVFVCACVCTRSCVYSKLIYILIVFILVFSVKINSFNDVFNTLSGFIDVRNILGKKSFSQTGTDLRGTALQSGMIVYSTDLLRRPTLEQINCENKWCNQSR